MAAKGAIRLAITIEESEARAAITALDKALDGVSDSARAAAKDVLNLLDKQIEGYGKATGAVKEIEQAFRKLGVKSEEVARQQRQAYIAAFEKIKNSGTASAAEISRAQKALEAQLARIDSQLDKNGNAFTRLKGIAGTSFSAIGRAVKTVGVALAGLVTSAGLAGFALLRVIKGSADRADELRDVAQSLGITVEELSVLRFAATQAGSDFEEVQNGLRRLSVQITEAAEGSAEANDIFKRLGVSVSDTAGNVRPTSAIFADVADAFGRMQAGAAKTTLAVDLFGKAAGPALIPLLNEGSAGLKAFRAEAEKLGAVTLSETADKADEFNDALGLLELAWQGLKDALAAPLLEPLAAAFQDLARWVAANRQAVADFAENALKPLIGRGVELLQTGDVSRFLRDGLTALQQLLNQLTDGSYFTALSNIASALGAIAGVVTTLAANADKVGGFFKTIATPFAFLGAAAIAPFDSSYTVKDLVQGNFARGGAVRGPGTATSDSILARLSHGEFVLRAAAVKHYGVDALTRLNSLAMPRFATGGLVGAEAPASRPIILNIGGDQFDMTAGEDTARAITRRLRRQALRSPTTKPRWEGA